MSSLDAEWVKHSFKDRMHLDIKNTVFQRLMSCETSSSCSFEMKVSCACVNIMIRFSSQFCGSSFYLGQLIWTTNKYENYVAARGVPIRKLEKQSQPWVQ